MQTQATFRQPIARPEIRRDPGMSCLLAETRPCPVFFHKFNDVTDAQGDQSGPLSPLAYDTVPICRLTLDGRRQVSAFHFAGAIFGPKSSVPSASRIEIVNLRAIEDLTR